MLNINPDICLLYPAHREQVEPWQIQEPLQVSEQEAIIWREVPQQGAPWPGLSLSIQASQQISFPLQVSKKWIEVIQKSQSLWV